ncbi:MAG TPA: alpha/beta hydrolase [Noviherbaspirillum sp.]|nr:alpha/beta hydrolase [Noviherbaspirillum sp.]
MTHTILILPGLFNSGEGHWQTVWETQLPNAQRVQQSDWNTPDRARWVANLDAAIAASDRPVILAAHSLGCALTAWWAKECGTQPYAAKVKGALLVAPPDVEHSTFPSFVTGFSPMPRATLPFKSIVVASSNDPWCSLPKAHDWAIQWGAQFNDIGPRGHINAESGLANWPQGLHWISALQEALP